MASCITTGVNSTCPQVQLTVTETSSTATTATLSWTLSYVTHGYTFNSSASKSYNAYIDGQHVASGSFVIGGKTTQTIKSGTITVNRGYSARSVSFSCNMDFTTAKWSGTALGNRTASGSISIGAKTSYSVSYNANGGSSTPGAQTKWHDEGLTLAGAISRAGHNFTGWCTAQNGSGAWYSAGQWYTTNSGLYLYAQWQIHTYTISYNANNGTGAPGNQTKTYNQGINLQSGTPTRTGYNFAGWNTASNGSGTWYSAGQWYTSNSGLTLYAMWNEKTYTVSYNANGGSGAPGAQTKYHFSNLGLSGTKPTRTGYTFTGWNTASNGSGTGYSAGGTYSSNSNVTLYAMWSANPYTVSYNANGGTGAPGNQTKYHDSTLKLSSTVPTRTYYNFLGWGTSASSTTVAYSPGSNYTANSAITLYAIWELAYIRPRIKAISVARCTSNGTVTDEGTYALVTCTWEIDTVATAKEAKIEWKYPSQSSYSNSTTVSLTGKSGSFTKVVGNNTLNIEETFNFRITISDNLGSTSTTRDLPPIIFAVDFLSGGKGMAVGRPAKLADTLDIGWRARMLNGSYVFTSTGISGTWGYVKLATIKVTYSWFDIPIELKISQRGRSSFATVLINFQNTESTDPGVNSFIFSANYNIGAYLVRSDVGTWDLYVEKTEGYDSVTVVDFKCDFEYFKNVATITWISNEQVNDINTVIADVSYVKASKVTIASGTSTVISPDQVLNASVEGDQLLTLERAFELIEAQNTKIAELEARIEALEGKE